MISIINDVLELTKIETGSIELELRPLHLGEVLSDVITEVEPMRISRNHTLDCPIPPGLPLVKADSSRLHQILHNLLCNAIKYTPEGGEIVVTMHEADIDALPQQVRDSIIGERRYLQINVRDTGVGIAEHELNSIFERFYRTENPLKVEAGGTGLGLSLTRPLIGLLEGHIWVESQVNQGSTFSFILPIAKP
jgi:signal transduction histidine kinase